MFYHKAADPGLAARTARGVASQHTNAAAASQLPRPALPRPAPAGASKAEVEGSPFVESLVEKGYEVLYMTDPLDEYVMQVS